MTGLAAIAEETAARITYSAEELKYTLHHHLRTAETAERRSRSLIGRFCNWATGEQPDYAPVSGRLLGQILDLLDLEIPDSVAPNENYLVRHDIIETAYHRPNTKID